MFHSYFERKTSQIQNLISAGGGLIKGNTVYIISYDI